MTRVANIFDRLPLVAIGATALFALEITTTNAAETTQAAMLIFFALALALAPLAQAAHLGNAPAAVEFALVFAVFFLLAAAIEWIAMRLLKGRSARVRWIVRAGALLAFAAIVFLTPRAGPMTF